MSKRKILCIAVHPDDETLGAGGSLLKWKAEGHEIHWLIITRSNEDLGYSADKVKKRLEEISKVNNDFGFSSLNHLDFHTTKLDEYPMSSLVSKMSECIQKIQPDTLLIPHRNDAHSDHRVAYEALKPFQKSFRYPYVKRILAMEVISETGYASIDATELFMPNFFVDVTSTFSKKISIMNSYEGEMGNHPFPRSEIGLTSLARLRGAMIGAEYAEAFQVIKYIE